MWSETFVHRLQCGRGRSAGDGGGEQAAATSWIAGARGLGTGFNWPSLHEKRPRAAVLTGEGLVPAEHANSVTRCINYTTQGSAGTEEGGEGATVSPVP